MRSRTRPHPNWLPRVETLSSRRGLRGDPDLSPRRSAVLALLGLGASLILVAALVASTPVNLVPDPCTGVTHVSPALEAECKKADSENVSALAAHQTALATFAEAGFGLGLASLTTCLLSLDPSLSPVVPRQARTGCLLIALGLTSILALGMIAWVGLQTGNAFLVSASHTVFADGQFSYGSYRPLELFVGGFTMFVASRFDGRPILQSVAVVMQLEAAPLLLLFTGAIILFDPGEALTHIVEVLSWAQVWNVPLVSNLTVFTMVAGILLVA